MKLKYVTVTGADNSIKPKELDLIAKNFPFVEFGILLNPIKERKERFPTFDWISELNQNLNLSGHFCGSVCKELVYDNKIFNYDIFRKFNRIQLNFSPYKVPLNLIHYLNQIPEKQWIFQIGKDDKDELIQEGLNQKINFGILFDQSGGKGILPQKWPNLKENVFCGYAGGLGPENIEEELKIIADIVGDQEIWIDMEGKIRDLEIFSIAKVNQVLEACLQYV